MTNSGDAEPRFADAAEILRLRSQDPAAFTGLVARTRRIVLGLGQSLGLKGADLDDAAAETFMAVFRALPSFEGRSAVTTWTYAIAARTLTRWRERLRRNTPGPLPDGSIADPRATTPAQFAEDKETGEKLWRAVAALDARSAMAVDLHYRRGLDLDAIATVLECPVGTVKTILFRARQALKVALGREDGVHV